MHSGVHNVTSYLCVFVILNTRASLGYWGEEGLQLCWHKETEDWQENLLNTGATYMHNVTGFLPLPDEASLSTNL